MKILKSIETKCKAFLSMLLVTIIIFGTVAPTFGMDIGTSTSTTYIEITTDNIIITQASTSIPTLIPTLENISLPESNSLLESTSLPESIGITTTITFNGQPTTVVLGEDGYFHVVHNTLAGLLEAFETMEEILGTARARQAFNDVANFSVFTIPRYVYLDGTPLPIDSPHVVNIIPADIMPSYDDNVMNIIPANNTTQLNNITPLNTIIPLSNVVDIPADHGLPAGMIVTIDSDLAIWSNTLTMINAGRTANVSALRYLFVVDGVSYEIFCLDPTLAGPENPEAVYTQTGVINNPALRNALRYGSPHNPYWDAPELMDRIWFTYVTRVAVAMAANPSATFTGDPIIIATATSLVNGISANQNFEETSPAITVNGVRNREDLDRVISPSATMAQSETFITSSNRRTSTQHNDFYFEWANGTPAGARLLVGGNTYTYPNVPAQRMGVNAVNPSVSFQLEMPNTTLFEGETAKVYLVGVHNDLAGQVRRLQHPTNPETWQDMAFYVPYIRSSAAFSFLDGTLVEEAHLRIIKTNMQGQPRGGATFNITGPSFPAPGHAVTVPVDGWNSGPIATGVYTITEITPPPGYTLASNPTQTITVTPNHTAQAPAIVTFANAPYTGGGGLRVVKINQYTGQPSSAAFTINGPDPRMPITINSGATVANLPVGEAFTVTTTTGFQETVTIQANQTTPITVTYYNGQDTTTSRSDTSITIQKIDAISRENIPGALMRLVGMSANYVTLPDGQTISFNNTGIQLMQVLTAGATTSSGGGVTSTVTDGVWQIDGLPYGFFMVYEYRAPDGFSLLPAHTARGFWLAPPNWNVDIVMPDFSLDWNANQGGSSVNWNLGDSGGGASAGGDPLAGWSGSTNVNIPGSEMTPPEFILEESPVTSSVLITFENFPFSEVKIYKREVSNGIGNNQLLEGATFRLQGFYPGYPGIPIDRTATTNAQGYVIFSDLPAGHYTITEIQPPTGFLLGNDNVWAVNVGWGQTVARGTAPSHTFFNIPKSSLEILKIDGITGNPLAGAIFELYDMTTGETWQATSGANGIATIGRGSNGNFLYPYRTYIIREIQAPQGYVLMEGPREIVLSPGDENRITWHNYINPGLTIIKTDQDTGERLAGAEFTIVAQGSGSPLPTDFPLITDNDGEIFIPWTLFAGESERNFIVTETVPPPGFNLANPNWQIVTMIAGHNHTLVFQNRRMPYIEIIKTDEVTGQFIPGAWFHVYYLGASPGTGTGNIGTPGLISGNPFITDQNGRIRIPHNYSGRFRITEIRAANGYWLDPLEQNRSWIIEVRDNEDYTLHVENIMLPTLVIRKRNAITWQGIYMTGFRVEHEVPHSPNRQLLGYFNTDRQGYIILPFVNVGWYVVTEVRAAPGMTLPSNPVSRIFLRPGDNTYSHIGAIRNFPGITRESHPTLMWPALIQTPPITPNEPPTTTPNQPPSTTPSQPPSATPNQPQPQRPQLTPELLYNILQILDMLRQMRA